MVDLHSHVLPGIDDGAPDMNVAKSMARRAAADGCAVLVATPHVHHATWPNTDRRRLEKLWRKVRLSVDGVIDIRLGSEIAINSESVEELYDLPESDLLTLADSRYVLIELNWQGLGPDILDVVHELVVHDMKPVIAHPERVGWLTGIPHMMEDLVDRGALLQLTAASVTGDLGKRLQSYCDDLLSAGLAHFVASDAHDLSGRPPGLTEAYRHVATNHSPGLARRVFVNNPQAVIDDQPLPAANGVS